MNIYSTELDIHEHGAGAVADAGAYRESLAEFLGFAAGALGIDSRLEEGLLELEYDSQQHPAWPRPHRAVVAVTAETIGDLQRRQLSPADGAGWLRDRSGPALGAKPTNQPDAVHEFSSRLFQAYQVDGGRVHLAGCHLQDVPFVRMTYLAADDPSSVEHYYFAADGGIAPQTLLDELGLYDVRPLGDHPPACAAAATEALVRQIRESQTDMSERFVAATLIGVKWADGHLQFDIGDQSAQVDFAGWTASLAPPPLECAASGLESYHVAAIDDGRIVAAEAIAVCEESGRRVLECERVTCSVTGKQIDLQLTQVCPVSGEPALASEFVTCNACRQQVSRKAIEAETCGACRSLQRVEPSDAQLARVLDRFSALGKFKRFAKAETPGVLRVEVLGGWRRLLVVVATEDLHPLAVATRGRFSSHWRQLPEADWPALLG